MRQLCHAINIWPLFWTFKWFLTLDVTDLSCYKHLTFDLAFQVISYLRCTSKVRNQLKGHLKSQMFIVWQSCHIWGKKLLGRHISCEIYASRITWSFRVCSDHNFHVLKDSQEMVWFCNTSTLWHTKKRSSYARCINLTWNMPAKWFLTSDVTAST
jgi:hypothetical protein